MTSNNFYCTECGAKISDKDRFCFTCGNQIQERELKQSMPYRLDEKFNLRSNLQLPLRTNLKYALPWRIFLLDNGFDKLHKFVNDICDLAYIVSCRIDPNKSRNQCYDTISNICFSRYETDFYPEDGYESIYIEFNDTIPSPFGELGVKQDAINFERSMRIFMARIEYDPRHGESNYAETQTPRIRKSKLVEKWGLDVYHKYLNRQPTFEFSYSITEYEISHQSEYSPNYKGLLSTLGLITLSENERNKSNLFKNSLSNINISDVVYKTFLEEEWQQKISMWRPFIDVNMKTGWLSSEIRRIIL